MDYIQKRMTKNYKKTRSHQGLQVVTLCISTTMVLILLGTVIFSVLSARNLSNWVKSNLTVTVMLNDSMSVNAAHTLCRNLYHKGYSRNIDYISKEQAKREQIAAMGTDPSEFLGFNPFVASLELQLKSDYANRDSLTWIAKDLRAQTGVSDVAYQEDLMDKVNNNLRKVNIILLVLAALLTFVSFSLISNTVRLSVYSRRFIIHTMKLVGASWGFIRKPFIRRAVTIGVIAALLACCVLTACVYALWRLQPEILQILSWVELLITGLSVLLFGIVITALCSYFAVNKFLKMTAGELYKI